MERLQDIRRFYVILDELARRCGPPKMLATCSGRLRWPVRGIYFFQEAGEERTDSGTGPRIVRVGTHALNAGSRTTLWNRLSQHRGQAKTGSGNHRGSIFRLLVGTALMDAQRHAVPTWGQGSHASRDVREKEVPFEQLVSRTIGAMPFVWLAVNDPPGRESDRDYIERHAIALLSNYGRPALDAPSIRRVPTRNR